LWYITKIQFNLLLNSDFDTVECLKSTPEQVLMDKNPSGLGFMQFGFVPVVDGVTIADDPYIMLKNGKALKAPILLG